MRSGNHLVDAQDDLEFEEEKKSKLLECGCKKGRCSCDEEAT